MDGDAICGYLQTKEQFDIYAYLPTHEGYSNLEYEDLGELRKTFLKIFEEQGMEGIKRFARNHKKQYRANPEKVYKCKKAIYRNLSAGAEFEKLMTSVHVQTVGMTQTPPEPSTIVKAKYPDLSLPDYVLTHDVNAIQMSYAMVVEMISQQPYDFDLQDYYNDSDEFEEEEEDGDTDASDDDEVSSHVNAMDTIEIDEAQMDAENIHQSSSVVVYNLRFPE